MLKEQANNILNITVKYVQTAIEIYSQCATFGGTLKPHQLTPNNPPTLSLKKNAGLLDQHMSNSKQGDPLCVASECGLQQYV